MNIRPATSEDILSLQRVLDTTGLFPSEMLPELMSGFLENPASTDLWLTCETESAAVGFCYAAPEKLTEGTWNMLVIAVHSSKHGSGCGSAIVKFREAQLSALGCRVLIADTSGKDEFAQTREFCR